MNKRLACLRLTGAGLAASLLLLGVIIQRQPRVQAAPGCQFLSAPEGTAAAFCDTFDAPAGTGNRSGDLNGTVWGVSRVTGFQNVGLAYRWMPTQLNLCGTIVSAQPENDVRICDGHVVEASSDGGGVTALTMYPKQPFDIAGRTGTIVFDVSDDSQGTHMAWPELWYTDKPVPDPFAHEGNPLTVSANGFGVRFAAVCAAGQGALCAPNCPNSNTRPVVTVDSAAIVRSYVTQDSFTGSLPTIIRDNCIVEASGPSQMNHIEIRVSTAQIDVYGTDAFAPGAALPPLKHLATIPNANLTLTRGLVWLVDAHYNGDKFGTQGTHTFAWDNVGFDGPVLPQDRAFDALDTMTPIGDGSFQLGWSISANSHQDISVPGVTQSALNNATGALLTFGFWSEQVPSAFTFSINGHSHSYPWPYPYQSSFTDLSLAIPIPLSDLHAGANTVTFTTSSSYSINIANVDLVAVGGGGSSGGPAPTPTATTVPGTPTPAPTNTPTPAPGPTPVPINNVPCTVQLPSGSQTGTCSGTFTPGG